MSAVVVRLQSGSAADASRDADDLIAAAASIRAQLGASTSVAPAPDPTGSPRTLVLSDARRVLVSDSTPAKVLVY